KIMALYPGSDRIREIFEAAMDLESSGARAAYVRAACGDNGQLLECVLKLLSANDAAESFLPDTPPASGWEDALGEQRGDRVGRYLLLKEIGAGGCGVVAAPPVHHGPPSPLRGRLPRDLGEALGLLRRYIPQAGERDLRGIEWRYAWQAARGDEF